MGKYEGLAKDIVKNIGGKENIDSLFHCITRIRFRLKDESKANDQAIKDMDGVVTLMKANGQYQVVIGNHVADVYDDVLKVTGLSGNEKGSSEDGAKIPLGQKLLDYIQAIFVPYIAVLCASGMIKGVIAILEISGVLTPEMGLHTLLAAVGDTVFYFLPVYVAYTFSTKLGLNKFTGVTIGLALVYPTLTGIAEDTMIFGINVKGIAYNSTVLPVIAGIALAYVLAKMLDKVVPTVVKSFVVPMLVIMIVVPIIYVFIGPIANGISNGLYDMMNKLINLSPIIAGAVAAFTWQIFVIFGVHQALIVPSIIGLSGGNPDSYFAFVTVAPFAQMAVVLTMWVLTKDQRRKSLMLPAWISGVFGITEPAIYGFTLPNIKLFIGGCIASALGGAYVGLMNVQMIRMAGLGVFSFPGAISPTNSGNLINFLIGNAISIGAAILITLFIYREHEAKVNEEEAKKAEKKLGKTGNEEFLIQPIMGKVLELKDIEDEAFSGGLLGQGLAIEPEDSKILAPVDATVATVFPTKHAIGLISDNGVEVLIHMGLNTVELGGEDFDIKVKDGDHVKAGDLIAEADFESIRKKGFKATTPIIITNSDDFKEVKTLLSPQDDQILQIVLK